MSIAEDGWDCFLELEEDIIGPEILTKDGSGDSVSGPVNFSEFG